MSTAEIEIALTAAITDQHTDLVRELYDVIAQGIARNGAAGALDALTELGITADMPARLAEREQEARVLAEQVEELERDAVSAEELREDWDDAQAEIADLRKELDQARHVLDRLNALAVTFDEQAEWAVPADEEAEGEAEVYANAYADAAQALRDVLSKG